MRQATRRAQTKAAWLRGRVVKQCARGAIDSNRESTHRVHIGHQATRLFQRRTGAKVVLVGEVQGRKQPLATCLLLLVHLRRRSRERRCRWHDRRQLLLCCVGRRGARRRRRVLVLDLGEQRGRLRGSEKSTEQCEKRTQALGLRKRAGVRDARKTRTCVRSSAAMPATGGGSVNSATGITSRAGVAPSAPGASPESSVFSSAVFALRSSSRVARRMARAATRALRSICWEDMSDIRMERGFAVYWSLLQCRVTGASGGDAREPGRCMCMHIGAAVCRRSAAAPHAGSGSGSCRASEVVLSASRQVGLLGVDAVDLSAPFACFGRARARDLYVQ